MSKKNDNSLEDYLLSEEKAWADDSSGETGVYLIKDNAGNIACYFSIKCGLVVGEDLYESLSEAEQGLVDAYVLSMKERDMEGIAYCIEEIRVDYPKRENQLIDLAHKRLERKQEAGRIGQKNITLNVSECFSAIEIGHFCKNENYQILEEIPVPMGFGLFWEKIVPLVLHVSDIVGCKYLYLFAADKTPDEDKRIHKLVKYYKTNLSFYECDIGMRLVKPDYDNECYGLIQDIASLKEKREAAWERFADVLESD